jgi:hypothetical protein
MHMLPSWEGGYGTNVDTYLVKRGGARNLKLGPSSLARGYLVSVIQKLENSDTWPL